MEITATRNLQAAIEAARQKNTALRPTQNTKASDKTTAAQSTTKAGKSVADLSIKSGKLVERFYGSEAKKQEQSVILIGSRFDAYA